MSEVRIHNLSISLDGFASGEGQAPDTPFGHAGERLHEWMFATPGSGMRWSAAAAAFAAPTTCSRRCTVQASAPKLWAPASSDHQAGRTILTGRAGGGTNPPFHTPVFVLTHRPRPSIEMEGGTTFHFLDATPAEALETAREAAGGQDVRLGGGPSVVRDFLAAGLVDHMHVVQVPIVLGRGVRLWDGLESLEEAYDIEAVSTPHGVTHLTFTAKSQ
jgi:dihydrofolate reductase